MDSDGTIQQGSYKIKLKKLEIIPEKKLVNFNEN